MTRFWFALVALALALVPAWSARAEVPSYNLSAPETQVVVSWLFGQDEYLDYAVNNAGVSARQALLAEPALDVTAWIRANTVNPLADEDHLKAWTECSMIWWIWKHDNVNVPRPQRPPETAVWVLILQGWDESITAGFSHVSQNERNASGYRITAEDGSITFMPSGNQLSAQQNMIRKVLGVLQ